MKHDIEWKNHGCWSNKIYSTILDNVALFSQSTHKTFTNTNKHNIDWLHFHIVDVCHVVSCVGGSHSIVNIYTAAGEFLAPTLANPIIYTYISPIHRSDRYYTAEKNWFVSCAVVLRWHSCITHMTNWATLSVTRSAAHWQPPISIIYFLFVCCFHSFARYLCVPLEMPHMYMRYGWANEQSRGNDAPSKTVDQKSLDRTNKRNSLPHWLHLFILSMNE